MSLQHAYAPALLDWFDRHGRHDLPWQHPRTPYRVWLGEIMLQQTQVAVAAPYFERFVAALPDLPALAHAPRDTVLALWSGLGYYARARNLHAAAQRCMDLHGGDLPSELDALMALPGIGRSTAGAILAQAWGKAAPILDGNVKRALCRLAGTEGWPGAPAVERQLWALAGTLLPRARLADYTQAQMDFGAMLCTRVNPACTTCPLSAHCVALGQGRVADLPHPRPGKPLPERTAHLLVLEDDDGRVLLQRRPPTGVWAGLWSLPQHAGIDEAREWFDRHHAGDFAQARRAEPFVHVFSHYRLRIHPHYAAARPRPAVGDTGDVRWASREELPGIGLPAPVRRLLMSTRAEERQR